MSDFNIPITPLLKKSKFFDIKLCIICQKNCGKLTSSENGRNKIKEAAAARKDSVFNYLKNVKENDIFFYHMTSSCYRSYTNANNYKLKLESEEIQIISDIEKNDDNTHSCVTLRNNNKQGSKATGSAISVRDILCVFCDQKSHKKVYDKSKITEDSQAQKFFQMTRYLKDEIFFRTAIYNSYSDIILKGLYYHTSCYKSYEYKYKMKQKSDCRSEINSLINDDAQVNHDFNDSELKLISIEEAINAIMKELESGCIIELSDIRDSINKRIDLEVSNAEIKKYLQKNYQNEIRFSEPPQLNRSTIIYHSNLKVEDLIYRLRPSEILKKSAEIIKNSLSKVDYCLNDKFCDVYDLESSLQNHPIPPLILNFFVHLFGFDKEVSEKEMLKIQSVFQHLVFIISKARLRIPLQVMLSLRIHDLCKSKSLITSLNHMGLGISYDDVERIKNGLAYFSALNYKDAVPLPTRFNRKIFTIAAIDNFDHNLANFSGLQSTHDTVSVVFQRETSEQIPPKPNISETQFNKRMKNLNMDMSCQK